jgi:hypothetical protein
MTRMTTAGRLAAVLLMSLVAAPLPAGVVDFNATFTNGGVPETQPFRMWAPDPAAGASHPPAVRGVVFVLPGSGEDWRNAAGQIGFQRAAGSLGYAVIAARSMIWGQQDSEIAPLVQRILNAAATASNRPEIVNAPFAAMGVSQGGYNATRITLSNPDRAIGFVNIRGGYGANVAPAGAALQVPGLNIVASNDTVIPPEYTYSDWAAWRQASAPHALMVDYNTTHIDTRKSQAWETAWYWVGEASRLRRSDGALSSTPGQLPLLDAPNYDNGWLAKTPTIMQGSQLTRPGNVEFASLASGSFADPPAAGSWVPSLGAAIVYDAFASGDGISRGLSPLKPRQHTLYLLLDPVHDTGTYSAPLFNVGETVAIRAEMVLKDQATHNLHLNSVDFYLDGNFLGTVHSQIVGAATTDTQWTKNVTFNAPGTHALIAIGRDAAGGEHPTFRTVLVAGAVPEPAAAVLLLAALAVLPRRR